MSVQHYKNGQLSIIAGAGGIGGGGGECDCENKTFTGTNEEIEQAIADGIIQEDYIVFVTDDVTDTTDVLETYEDIMNNTEEDKLPGALGVKEGFEAIIDNLNNVLIDTIETSFGSINVMKQNRNVEINMILSGLPKNEWTVVCDMPLEYRPMNQIVVFGIDGNGGLCSVNCQNQLKVKPTTGSYCYSTLHYFSFN